MAAMPRPYNRVVSTSSDATTQRPGFFAQVRAGVGGGTDATGAQVFTPAPGLASRPPACSRHCPARCQPTWTGESARRWRGGVQKRHWCSATTVWSWVWDVLHSRKAADVDEVLAQQLFVLAVGQLWVVVLAGSWGVRALGLCPRPLRGLLAPWERTPATNSRMCRTARPCIMNPPSTASGSR